MPGGYDLVTFRPNDLAIRADYASLFFGMSGEALDAGNGTCGHTSFSDIDPRKWYSQAVEWCVKQGVMLGTSDGIFNPEGSVTCEQAAAFFYMYSKLYQSDNFEDIDDEEVEEQISKLNNKDQVSDWAKPTVAWFVKSGLINNTAAYKPQGHYTRSQLAAIALKAQPQPLVEIKNKVVCPPTATLHAEGKISIVARASNAKAISWERAKAGTDTWQAIDGSSPHLEIERSDYFAYDYRCTFTFTDNSAKILELQKDGSGPFEPSITPFDYKLENGVLTISSIKGIKGELPRNLLRNAPWIDQAGNIKKIVFEGELYAPQSLVGFGSEYYPSLQSVDLTGLRSLNTVYSSEPVGPFQDCIKLKEITVGKLDESARISIPELFSNCTSLEKVAFSEPITFPEGSYITGLFSGCSNLKTVTGLEKLDVSALTNFESIFNGCSNLESLKLDGWENAKPNNIADLFNGCSKLTSIPVENWNTTELVTANNAFRNCSSLTKLDLSKWKTPKLASSAAIFAGCSSLTTLNLDKWDTTAAKNADNHALSRMFEDCSKLDNLTLGEKFKFASYSTGLREAPSGMTWKAKTATTEFDSTAKLIGHQNTRTYGGAETYRLVKASAPNPDGGNEGGGEDETAFETIDKTGGKVSVGTIGDASSKVTKVELNNLEKENSIYKLLASQAKKDEKPCGAYSISMSGKGKVVAIFNVSSKLNGQVLRIVQLKEDGTITSSPAAVIDGTAALIIDGSQSVMLLAPNDAEKPAATFSDVPTDAWYVTGGILDYSVNNDLLTGYGNGKFGPDDPFTRGQAITVLWRIAGCPSASAKAFSDVDYSQYYGKAINWARKTGVVSGYEDTNTFKPDVPASRAEIAAMLANYASIIESMDTSSDGGSLASKADAASVPEWARGVMGWAVDQGIISGRVIDGKEYLAPSEQTLRCEAAKMLVLFHRDTLHIKGGTEA